MIPSSDDGADAVQDAERLGPAEDPRHELRPGGVGELERHAGDRQGEEAEHHQDVQRALVRVKRRYSFVAPFVARAPCASATRPASARAGRARPACASSAKVSVPTSSAGHAPERPEQPRVALGVVVRGVRQVAGESPVRARVALPAGRDDVAPAERARRDRSRREDVVRAVAVVALGRALGAQARDLAVERVEERLACCLVAAAALLHHARAEAGHVGARDLCATCGSPRRSAGACRSSALPVAVDAGLERLLDPVVALPHVSAMCAD